ncbi:MAG: U32 family peptidase [Bacteroidales bacterium]|nr:U32 family peptidase [Bacteroidales bacterium]MDD3522483.1 U32 family peptidase [Bacteroidales bacterium]MDD4030010.1 U32 family peptidase [Bacteroidales bacterium]MDD4435556.1 U32 family peptidase [Bacteroidales bacterium]MDD5732432.1 U32 family peptidase [Bacteroidales bacterium]
MSEQLWNKPEIMAPAGNWASLTAAAQGGAGSVYFGVGELNMRAHAAHNFQKEDLPGITAFCQNNGMRSYLTVNTIFYDQDLEELKSLLQAAAHAGISAVIASDMAAIEQACSLGLEVHISTQLNVSNIRALAFYARFADVVVLARELTLEQIGAIAREVRARNITGPSGNLVKLELFCHGALCMAISGKCYMSLHHYNKSANRGACYQICRRSYTVTDNETGEQMEVDNQYIMSPKDLCTVRFLDKILASGIEILKIEGRARSPEYVKTTAQVYNQAARAVCNGTFTPGLAANLEERLKMVFNRGFWGGYYLGQPLGQWSEAYGNQATQKKTYAARVTNYFSRPGVAELKIEAVPLHIGDQILIIGPTTGVVEDTVREIRLEGGTPVTTAPQGSVCSIPIATSLRRSDKVYRLENNV